MPRSAVSSILHAVRHRAAVLLHRVYRPARLTVELVAESTIIANPMIVKVSDEIPGAAEELEPIHRADHLEIVRAQEIRMGWLWKLQVRQRVGVNVPTGVTIEWRERELRSGRAMQAGLAASWQ